MIINFDKLLLIDCDAWSRIGNIPSHIWMLLTYGAIFWDVKKSSVGVRNVEGLEHAVRLLRIDPLG